MRSIIAAVWGKVAGNIKPPEGMSVTFFPPGIIKKTTLFSTGVQSAKCYDSHATFLLFSKAGLSPVPNKKPS